MQRALVFPEAASLGTYVYVCVRVYFQTAHEELTVQTYPFVVIPCRFFLTYQGVKTIMEVQRGEEDLVNVGVATVTAALPFIGSTVMRQNVPYALMLVALDHFHEELSAHRK